MASAWQTPWKSVRSSSPPITGPVSQRLHENSSLREPAAARPRSRGAASRAAPTADPSLSQWRTTWSRRPYGPRSPAGLLGRPRLRRLGLRDGLLDQDEDRQTLGQLPPVAVDAHGAELLDHGAGDPLDPLASGSPRASAPGQLLLPPGPAGQGRPPADRAAGPRDGCRDSGRRSRSRDRSRADHTRRHLRRRLELLGAEAELGVSEGSEEHPHGPVPGRLVEPHAPLLQAERHRLPGHARRPIAFDPVQPSRAMGAVRGQ